MKNNYEKNRTSSKAATRDAKQSKQKKRQYVEQEYKIDKWIRRKHSRFKLNDTKENDVELNNKFLLVQLNEKQQKENSGGCRMATRGVSSANLPVK